MSQQDRYLIPHHPGDTIMFNMKRALCQAKNKKTSRGHAVYSERWTEQSDKSLYVRIKNQDNPFILGHHGHEEIFCGQIMSQAQVGNNPESIFVKVLNFTKRRNCTPIARTYVFFFHSIASAKAFMLSINAITDCRKKVLNKENKNKNENEN